MMKMFKNNGLKIIRWLAHLVQYMCWLVKTASIPNQPLETNP